MVNFLRTSALLLVIALAAAACGDAETSSTAGGDTTRPTAAQRTQQPDERDRSGSSRQRSDERPGRGGENGQRRKIGSAILNLSGDQGTGYAGVCKIGDREVELEGTVPETVDLDLNGEPLECEIENSGSGALKADLSVGDAHYTQQTSARGGTLNFVLSGDGYTSSTSSVTAVEAETPDAVSSASSSVEAGPDVEK